jgi:hypothetical protein
MVSFFMVISVTWLMLQVWWANLVDSSFFLFFLIDIFFFSFIIQHFQLLVDYELDFVICFDLFSMKLSQFHDPDHEFCKLTQVNLWIRLIFCLNFITQQWVYWELSFICSNLIYLILLWSHDSGYEVRRSTWLIQYFVVSILKKKDVLNFFE